MARRNTNSDLDLLLGGGETKSTRKRKTTPAPNGAVAGNPSGPAMAGSEAPKRRRKTLKDNDTLRQLLG